MGLLSERLNSHRVLGLDTSVFIYHIEAHPVYLPLTQEVLTGVQAGNWQAVTSVITLMELTVHPWRLNLPSVAKEYEALLIGFPHLTVADVTKEIAQQAAQLRAHARLKPADALQVATALVHDATAFVTNDKSLRRLEPTLDVIILNDFIP